jgi:hypothetical protein
MNLRRIVCSALMISGLCSAAWARDVCLVNSGNDYLVLRKVKALHPGGSVQLNGYRYLDTPKPLTVPVEGSAMMKSDGTVVAALFVHGIVEGSNDFTLAWTTDLTFAGKMSYDNDGDFWSDGLIPYASVDCHDVPIP